MLVSLCVLLCSSPSPQEQWVANPVRIQVTSVVTGKPVQEAFVLVTGDTVPGSSTSAVSGEDGWTNFPELAPLPDVGGEAVPTMVTVRIEYPGYLPLRRQVSFSEQARSLSCPLVPTDTGYVTPFIRAASGGRFHLEGLGTVRVAANALAYDVSLRLIPVPTASWTEIPGLEEMPRYQIWLTATDATGSPAQGALPAQPGGIILEGPAMPFPYLVPDDAVSEVWTTHCLGESFSQDLTCVAQVRTDERVFMPLGEGHNVLYQTYAVPETACNGEWGPWMVELKDIGVQTQVIATIPVMCGVHTASGGCGVKAGEEISGTLTWSEANHREYGVTGATIIGRVNAKVGFNSSYSEETGQVTTKSREGNVAQEGGSTITRRPMGQQGGGYDCISGDCHFGEVYRKYRILAKRRRVCPSGQIDNETKVLGEVGVFAGVQTWYDLHWDSSCPGCAATGDVPPVPQPH